MKAHKLEVLVIDFDNLGAESVKDTICTARYPNHCISPSVEAVQTVEIGPWSDDHPLNNSKTCEAEYKRLFERSSAPISQMTDAQIDAVYCEMYGYDPGVISAPESLRNFARAVLAAAAPQAQASAAQVAEPAQKPWHQVATVTMDGHQLREALNFLNPDGDNEPDQLDEALEFAVVQHKYDDGTVSTGLCCWNDDTDGVYPLTGDGAYAPKAANPTNQPQLVAEQGELPTVPQHISALITAYGDARADMGGSPKAMAALVKGLREWAAIAASQQAAVSQPQAAYLAAIEEALKVMRDNGLDECYAYDEAIEALAAMKNKPANCQDGEGSST